MSFKSTQTTDQKQKSSTTPVEDPAYAGLKTQLLNMAMAKLNGSKTSLAGYEGTGIANINNAFDATNMARENALTSRGLATSPIAGNADIMAQNSKAGQMATFENTLPLIQRDMDLQDWTQAFNVFAARPMGSSSEGSTTGTTTTSTPVMQTVIPSIASMLGLAYGQGLFSKKPAATGDTTNWGTPWGTP
jgi:hypothetical protein